MITLVSDYKMKMQTQIPLLGRHLGSASDSRESFQFERETSERIRAFPARTGLRALVLGTSDFERKIRIWG